MPHKNYDPDGDPGIGRRRAKDKAYLDTHTTLGVCLLEAMPMSKRAVVRIYEAMKAGEIDALQVRELKGDLYADPDEVEGWVKTTEAECIIYPRRRAS